MAAKWKIEGPHIVNCNCDFGCPCQYMALPTDGSCKAVVGWIINKGHYGDTNLDGLIAVNTYDWPKAIHEGNGTMQTIIDERADDAQRAALQAIMQGEGGEPGSTMLLIYRTMCSTYHDPVFKPIDLEIDLSARKGHLRVPGMIDTEVEPLKNPVTGVEWQARIDLPNGKEFRQAEVASGTTKATGTVPLDFTNSHAHMADIPLSSEGVVG